ncbi:hypothetical protein EDB83DRAFT_1786261 [Lactarius deliciosus]|nr:hypothetical protein EDB83DRAFT_1786261 [Lactarius deliciosus]
MCRSGSDCVAPLIVCRLHCIYPPLPVLSVPSCCPCVCLCLAIFRMIPCLQSVCICLRFHRSYLCFSYGLIFRYICLPFPVLSCMAYPCITHYVLCRVYANQSASQCGRHVTPSSPLAGTRQLLWNAVTP